ncbi:MAG: hypothetical protein JXR58_11420 [Bacteroidales bacterium]|nr:hypothetical protein [Bacteroidales bacterium]
MVGVTCVTNATIVGFVVNITTFAANIITKDMPADEINNKLLTHLSEKVVFTKDDILKYYIDNGIDISDEAIRIRIHRLKKKGIVCDVAKSKYIINNKSLYIPGPDKLIRKINKLFVSKYENVDYCIWSTAWLANFMHHIPFSYFHLIETDKDVCESAFYHLKDNGINIYLEPDAKQIEKYVLPEDDSVMIRPIITRAPIKKEQNIRFASIEKILVDIFCDQDKFYLYSGREQDWIFENILDSYNINFSTLFAYAERRKRDKELREYLLKNFGNQVKDIIE